MPDPAGGEDTVRTRHLLCFPRPIFPLPIGRDPGRGSVDKEGEWPPRVSLWDHAACSGEFVL